MIRKKLNKYVVLLVILSFFSEVFGIESYRPEIADPFLEEWRWKHFEELDGKGVKAIIEGNNGNMWFATNQGIYKYDGYVFHLQDTLSGLTGLPVIHLCKRSDGSIYATTPDGLFQLENDTWEAVFPDLLYSFPVSFMREIKGEGLFCLSENGFLQITDSNEIKIFTSEKIIQKISNKYPDSIQWITLPEFIFQRGDHIFTDIIKDEYNYFWLCQDQGDTGRIIKFKNLNSKSSLPHDYLILESSAKRKFGRSQKLLKASNGDIWVVCGHYRIGIHIFNKDHYRYLRLSNLFGGDEFHWDINQDKKGKIMISGIGQFFVYDQGKWSHYTADDVPIPPSCRILMSETNGGQLWIGGFQNKIYRLDYSDKNWLTYKNLNFQCKSGDGKIWFIESSGRIVVKSGNNWISYGPDDGLIEDPIRLICTSNGQIWTAGSHEGVAATAFLKDSTWAIQKHPLLSWGIDYRSVFEASDGSLWFGSAVDFQRDKGQMSGLLHLRNPLDEEKEWVHYHTPTHGSMSLNTYGITQSPDGRIWKGGLGLSFFSGERWFKIESPKELTDYVNTVYCKPGVRLYAGSRYYGLFRFDGDNWQVFNTNTGLTSNTIISIYANSDSSIWLATDNDISYFNGTQWFVDLFPSEMTMKMEGGSLFVDEEGQLWINKSPREWKRRAFEYSKTPPDAYEKFKVYRYKSYEGPPETYLDNYPDNLAATGQIIFFWEGKDFFKETEDNDLKYSYRINGGEWSEFSSRTNQTYNKLPSGKYAFEVRTIDSDMNIDQSPAVARFTISPPIWKQAWFILLILGMVSTSTYFIVQIVSRDRKLLVANKELNNANRILSEQKEKINDQKENLNRILIKNEDLSRTKLKFFTNISHEFRTPLTLIVSNLENLYVRNMNYNERVLIYNTIKRNSYRLLNLINQLLEFRKIESGTMNLITQKGDLISYIKELTGLFKSLADKKKISLIIDSANHEFHLSYFDPDKIEKILYNLLSNAFKHTPKGGQIEVRFGLTRTPARFTGSKLTDTFFKISVIDNGEGISEKNLKQIFDRYFSDESGSKYALENTGIGLSYVKDLVTAHGGTIDVYSKPGEGTKFDVYIPKLINPSGFKEHYSKENVNENDFSNSIKYAIDELSSNYREDYDIDYKKNLKAYKGKADLNPTILIAEDNYDMIDLLSNTLSHKFNLFVAINGSEAIDIVNENSIDLILSDVMMPVMDGIELCKQLKNNINTSHIPIILLTAKSFQEHQIEGLETGADDYIVKPFNQHILLARVENVLKNRNILKQKFSKDFSFEPREVKLPSAEKEFLQKLVSLMEDNISDPSFNVERMAREMCISHAHFILKVKNLTGQKPHNLLKSYRLKKAKQLLCQKEISVSEVAYSVGYDNPSSFTRAFKALYKQSPSEFMELSN